MDNIRQELLKDDAADEGIFALLFPENRDSEVRGRIQLPNSGLPTNPKMRVILRLLSQLGNVVMPELEAEAKIDDLGSFEGRRHGEYEVDLRVARVDPARCIEVEV